MSKIEAEDYIITVTDINKMETILKSLEMYSLNLKQSMISVVL